jgi:glycine cleavage system H protein
MSEIPGDLKFLKSHEWARLEGNGRVTVGISDHAQGLLGDLVYVELPSVGDTIEAGNAAAVVESVKAELLDPDDYAELLEEDGH